jgi:membrane protein
MRVPWALLKGTIGSCMKYRVTGLAAEGAFFAVLSLPPLVFGLAGTLGYVVGVFGAGTVESVKAEIVEIARRALTEDSVQGVIVPTLDAVLSRGRADIISIGFVLALWSGSRALNVFIDTISIMHGQMGRRGIVKTRLLSFSMYIVALGIGVVVLPLVLAGPAIVAQLLPPNLDFLNGLYWPVVLILSTGFVATLYHIAVPQRSPWLHDLPGSVLALTMWIGGSYLLRWVLGISVGGESTSIYGPLAAPIAILLWLYLIVITLLIGAAFNATVHQVIVDRRESAPAMKAEPPPVREA